MKKIIYFLGCFLFVKGNGLAQTQTRAALEAQSPQEIQDFFERINTTMQQGDIDLVARQYDSLRTRAGELKDTVSMVVAEGNKGELYFMLGKMDAAEKAFKKGNEWATRLPIPDYEAYHYARIGAINKHLGQNDTAFYYLRKAQQFIPKVDDKSLYRQINNQLGLLHDAVGKGDSAVHYYLETLQMVDDSEPYVKGAIYTNLGKSFSYRYNYQKSIEYYDKVLQILDKENYPKAYTIALAHKAMSMQHNRQAEAAEAVILNARQMVADNKLNRLKILVYSVWISILNQLDRVEAALTALRELDAFGEIIDQELLPEYLLTKISLLLKTNDLEKIPLLLVEAQKSVQKNNSLINNIKLNHLKAKYFEAIGQSKTAYTALQKHNLYKDSLFKISQSNAIHDLDTQYKTQEKEQRITQLELEETIQHARISRQNWIIMLTSFALLLLVTLGYFILKQNRKIKTQNALIQKSLAEKNILLKEIHHRVKNNLQVISSLLGIQSRTIKDEAALEAITEGRTRVQTMSLIHQNLYKEDNLRGIDVKDYLGKLSENLFNTYTINPDQIQLELDIDKLILDVESVVPLGLIINELISNALKYAFPENTKGVIQIVLKDTKDGLQLSVKDNGIGVADTSKLFEGESFGYDLIDAFKSKLKADLYIDGSNGMDIQMLIRNYKKVA